MASCGSVEARDDASWGSLAAAFLAAGSETVIATERPVDDAITNQFVRRFYEAGGAQDPIGALARAQLELSKDGLTDWTAFTSVTSPPTRD